MPIIMCDWTWLIISPRGMMIRVFVGLAFFATLLAIDLRKRGRHSTRLREYGFLATGVAIGAIYGALNDLITSTISWEYFYYGKDLVTTLGPVTPPNSWALHLCAMRIGMLASGSAALIAAAILLVFNSFRLNGATPLPMRRLFGLLGFAWSIAIAGSVVLGLIGIGGGLAWMSADLTGIVRDDLFRPRRFLAVYGIHVGAYVGGVLGTIIASVRIAGERTRNGMGSADAD